MTGTGSKVALSAEQEELRIDVSSRLDHVLEGIRRHEDMRSELTAMGRQAATLHRLLKDSGVVVQHHAYMIKNRGLPPDDPEFYRHVHPVEDLLKFLDDRNANLDPVDKTLHASFDVRIYSRRWGHEDTYQFTRTPTGWDISHIQQVDTGIDGRVDNEEGTGLLALLDQDSINYPDDLPGYLAHLWEVSRDRGLSHGQVQAALQQLAQWINVVERASPAGVFEDLK